MSELAYSIESPAKVVVTKGRVHVKVSNLGDSYFKFIFSLSVSYNFKIVKSFSKSSIRHNRAEKILIFLKECAPIRSRKLDSIRAVFITPSEFSKSLFLQMANDIRA